MAKEFDFSLVKKQPVNFRQIELTVQKAWKSVEASQKVLETDTDSCFVLAYEAMLKASLALMLSKGYRPRVGLGHHKILVEFASHILGAEFKDIIATYDRMRAKRNKVVYDVSLVSESEALQAIESASRYIEIIRAWIETENPQLKLL